MAGFSSIYQYVKVFILVSTFTLPRQCNMVDGSVLGDVHFTVLVGTTTENAEVVCSLRQVSKLLLANERGALGAGNGEGS